MSDKTYKHDETGKLATLSEAVAALFPAFKLVDVDPEDQSNPDVDTDQETRGAKSPRNQKEVAV